MPRRTRAHELDDEAERALVGAIPPGWVFRLTDRHDYGVDGTIEIFADEEPTGDVLNVQLSTNSRPQSAL